MRNPFSILYDKYIKPLILWVCTLAVFQNITNPEKQHWLVRKIIDFITNYLVYIVCAYICSVLFIHYDLPDFPFLESVLSLIIPLMPTFELRVKALRTFLSYLPGHNETFRFIDRVQKFILEFVRLFSTLPVYSHPEYSLYLVRRFFSSWLTPAQMSAIKYVFRWLGIERQFREHEVNFTKWLLMVKFVKNREDCRNYTEPFYPIILWAYNTSNDRNAKHTKYWIRPSVIRDITRFNWSVAKEQYIDEGFHPEKDFYHLFNYNRHLLARFEVESKRIDDNSYFREVSIREEDKFFSHELRGVRDYVDNVDHLTGTFKDNYIDESYREEMEKDLNFWTGVLNKKLDQEKLDEIEKEIKNKYK